MAPMIDTAIRSFMLLPDMAQTALAFVSVCAVWFGAMHLADRLAGSIRE